MSRSLTIVLFFCALICAAQETNVSDIRATGSRRYTSAEIAVASGLQKGHIATVAESKAAAEKLAASGVFREVAFHHISTAKGVAVEFQVKDADKFVPADFENIVWMSPAELESQLHDRVPLFKGVLPVKGSLGDEVAKALQDILASAGVKGHVSYELPGGEGDDQEEIQRAKAPQPAKKAVQVARFRVDDIDIKVAQIGTQVGTGGASAEFPSEVQTAAARLIGQDYAREKLKDFAAHQLRNVFLRHGYLKTEIGEPQPKVISNEGGVTNVQVLFPVEPGKQYILGALKWSGATVMTPNQLGEFLHLGAGAPVDGFQLEQDVKTIQEQYARRGYLKAEVNALPHFDDQQGTVSYQMAVIEGAQYKMGQLDVEGLDPASAEKLRNAWKLRQGEPYDTSYISEFMKGYSIPEGMTYNVEKEIDEPTKVVDTTLVFTKQH